MKNWLETWLSKIDIPDWDEILINRHEFAWIIKDRQSFPCKSPFSSYEDLINGLQDFCFRQNARLDPLHPAAGGWVDELGLRWHILLPPMSRGGAILSLRRHRFHSLSLDDFHLTKKEDHQLSSLVRNGKSLIICGPTGSGKTTLLHALLQTFCQDERIIIIESIAELAVHHPKWIALQQTHDNVEGKGAFSLDYIFAQALRLRPDRFVLGEIRQEEAKLFFELGATGHGGTLTTFHARCGSDLKLRLRWLLGAEYLSHGAIACQNVWAVFMTRDSPPRLSAIEPLYLGD